MESQQAWIFGQEWELNVQQQLRMSPSWKQVSYGDSSYVDNNRMCKVIAGFAVMLIA